MAPPRRRTPLAYNDEELLALEEDLGVVGPLNLRSPPSVQPIPIDPRTPRLTDRAYPPMDDAWNRAEPTPEELAADEAYEDAEVLAPASPTSHDPGALNPYDDGPAAIDKTAASVPEAQKGTPAGQLGSLSEPDTTWASELQQYVQERVLDKPPASTEPLNQAATQYALESLLPKEGFSRDERAARARAAYGEDTPASTRWEDEFTSSHQRLTDKDVERSFLLQSLMWGNDQGMKFREMQRREQAGYEEGIAKARERDRANTRISRGLAEAIAATGNVSPEEAVNLTYGDPIVKAFSSGMYSQGGRAEGQTLGREKALIKEAFDLHKAGVIDERQRDQMVGTWLNQLQVQDMRSKAAADQLDPEIVQMLLPTALQRAVKGLRAEQAARVAQGDTKGLTPDQVEQVQKVLPFLMQNLSNAKGAQKTADAVAQLETTGEAKGDIGARSASKRARAVSPFSMTAGKERSSIRTMFATVSRAKQAWQEMSPEARELFTQVGPKTPEAFANAYATMTGMKGYQAAATNLRSLTNQLTRQMAGLSQTESELTNQLKEQGLATGYWDPFKDPSGFAEALDRIEEITKLRAQSMKKDGSWDASEVE